MHHQRTSRVGIAAGFPHSTLESRLVIGCKFDWGLHVACASPDLVNSLEKKRDLEGRRGILNSGMRGERRKHERMRVVGMGNLCHLNDSRYQTLVRGGLECK